MSYDAFDVVYYAVLGCIFGVVHTRIWLGRRSERQRHVAVVEELDEQSRRREISNWNGCATLYPRTGVRVRLIDCDSGVVDENEQQKTLRR